MPFSGGKQGCFCIKKKKKQKKTKTNKEGLGQSEVALPATSPDP